MPEPPFDLQQAHRWFAVELNNLAWDLIEAEKRAAVDVERMVHAAHASCYHWMQAGKPINHLRAECLVTTAYITAEYMEPARRHSRHCLELSKQITDGQTAFDRAMVFGSAAKAALLAGETEEAQLHYQRALEEVKKFEHPDENKVFQNLYSIPDFE